MILECLENKDKYMARTDEETKKGFKCSHANLRDVFSIAFVLK